MKNDIVPRLRIRWDSMTDMGNAQRAEAGDEIERLRVIVQGWEHSARNAERDMEALRAERDEARRLVCELAAEYKAEMFCPKGTMVPKSDRALAKAYGWDCFKENTND